MSNVTSVHTETTGTLATGRHQLRGYHIISGGTAGEVIFRDGGASGTVRLQFNIGTGTQPIVMNIPDDGILFLTDVHVTLPATAKTTVFLEAV
jgi:hypothetical protein